MLPSDSFCYLYYFNQLMNVFKSVKWIRMKKSTLLTSSFLCLYCASVFGAVSWVQEGAREFEELRLRQLETVQKDSIIKPFVTDGCSGFQSETWENLAKLIPAFKEKFGRQPPWEHCCVAHDKVYWQGIVSDGYNARLHADEALRQCVQATGDKLAPALGQKYSVSEEKVRKAFAVTATLMYKAVRLGGMPCSLLPWRWGYGWPTCAFAALSDTPEPFSDIKDDEHVTFFATSGWLDSDKTNWNIPIHGWIYQPANSTVRKAVIAGLLDAEYDLQVTPATEENFSRRVNLLIADNEENKTLIIRLAGKDLTLPASQENGHISTLLKIPSDVVNAFSSQGRLHFFAVTRPEDKRHFEGEVRLVAPTGISVVSDIDDTVKITDVKDHTKLFDNTFYQDFSAVPGMSGLYRQLADHKATIYFVSSSPWQLYDPLQEFIQKTGFPAASLDLKYVRFKDRTFFNLFKPGTETKPQQIEPILQRYPDRKFILIGDSGEQDPEVYGDIARRYRSQIQYILIRNVDHSNTKDERFIKAFKGISKHHWKLFDNPAQIDVDELLKR